MNTWEGIQTAIRYIEDNLTEELDIADIAARANISAFHFQRIFSVLCGFTVGEYIRSRRLTLAAQELSATGIKVIDAAVKYGYDSPDSFARAFTRFHSISPSSAKEKGARLRSFAPLKIIPTLEGGTMTEYRIVEKAAFTVIGKKRRFSMEGSYSEIPKFWQEHMSDSGFVIGDPRQEVPEGYETRQIPAPKALRDVNTRIWNEWLPNCTEYRPGGNYDIEMYTAPTEDPAKTYSEIWIPVVKA